MKKLLLLVLLSISASPWTPDALLLGAGNDRWGLGLVRNDDDQLSYSVNAELSAPMWFLSLEIDGITNRGWREGWSVSDSTINADSSGFFSGRIDYASLLAGLRLSAFEGSHYSLFLEPGLGVSLAGDLYSDAVQNLIHRLSDRPELVLSYDFTGLRPYLYQSLLLRNSLKVAELENSALMLSLDGFAEASYGFTSTEKVSLELSFGSSEELLSFSFGYQLNQSCSDSATMSLYSEFINGWYYDLMIKAGALRLEYHTFLKSNFGYGSISVDALSLFSDSRWKQSDLTLHYGKSWMLSRSFNVLSLEVPLKQGLSLAVAMKSDTGKQYDNPDYPDVRLTRNNLLALAGVRYSYELEAIDCWVTPSAKLSAGVLRLQYHELYNMDSTSVASVPYESIGPRYSFVLDGEVSLTILPPGLLRSGSADMQLTLACGLLFLAEPAVLSAAYWDVSDSSLVPHYDLLLSIGFDL